MKLFGSNQPVQKIDGEWKVADKWFLSLAGLKSGDAMIESEVRLPFASAGVNRVDFGDGRQYVMTSPRSTVRRSAAPAGVPPFIRTHTKSVTFYYKSPEPELGIRMLNDLLREENLGHHWFANRQHVLDLISAQLGDIAHGHARIVRQSESAFGDAPLPGRRIIAKALMNCGDKATLEKITTWLTDAANAELVPQLEALQRYLRDVDRTHVRDRPARIPGDVDFLWTNFFITGEYAPVSRILDVFDLPEDPKHDQLKRVARFSLESNLQQHWSRLWRRTKRNGLQAAARSLAS